MYRFFDLLGRVGCALSACLLLTQVASAQYGLTSGVYNRLSLRVPANNTSHIPPVGPNASPTGDPTITPQYANAVEGNASLAIQFTPALASGGTPRAYPSSGTVVLRYASLGTSFASGVPRYFFGDQILPPSSIVSTTGATRVITDPATYWRAEPVRAGEVLTNPTVPAAPAVDYRTGASATIPALASGVLPSYYYSPHARLVFANTPGLVDVTWRSSIPDPLNGGNYVFYKESFTVSSGALAPVRTMFWTEKSFSAPRITIPTGKVVTVNPVYSNAFPETVSKEFVVVGGSQADPNASSTEVLRTLWYEKTNGVGELHAYNITGRIFVEYLGTRREDGTHEFLGADIVSVEQALQPQTLTVELGNEIRPQPDENLFAQPVTSNASTNNTTYYGSSSRPDGTLAYYAERFNDVEDRVTFFWLEEKDVGIANTSGVFPGVAIEWPKHLSKYLLVWPTQITDFVASTVGSAGSTVDNGTGLQFDGGKVPSIIYQDAPGGNEASIDGLSQRLVVDLSSSSDQLNRALLKFTGDNGGVWYVRLMTQADGRSGFAEGDNGPALNSSVYVGDRLQPPSPAYSVAGYVASGTCYSPTAYVDPFASGVAAAEKGAIIPVNALPGTSNPLTVWWFKKVQAPSSEFRSFYTTAKVGRYSVAYQNYADSVSDDFETGSPGWSSTLTAAGPTGKFMGPYGTSPSISTEKTVDLPDNALPLTISFNFLRIDTWDNESFKVLVNGNLLIQQNYSMSEVKQTVSGQSAFSDAIYEWTIAPVAGGYYQFYGTDPGWFDQNFIVTINVTPATPTSLPALSVGFESSLNQAATDEAFGIDNFSVYSTQSSTQSQIILASNQGSGALSPALSAATVYNQPDPSKIGYNPNEEHGLMLGGRAYALRDDLNLVSGTTPASIGVTFSSLPRVLLQYQDPGDQRPSMMLYNVVRETTQYPLSYGITAGTIIGSPMPLPLMPLPVGNDRTVRNLEVVPVTVFSDPPSNTSAPTYYTPFTFKDRKGYDWVYRGPHDGGSKALGMHFYYVMQPDFAFPGLAVQPAVGTILPYLRPQDSSGAYVGDPVTGNPQTVLYYPAWPANPPTLSVGETLALPKRGLPSVRGQTSARVLYQQSIAKSSPGQPSVLLQDPTRAKSVLINDAKVGLSALPASLQTTQQNGKTYFQLAQPHLQQRFYFDPSLGDKGGLVLVGEFKDEVAGEDYFNLNTLSTADVDALESLVDDSDLDKGKWNSAIVHLSTAVETFKENPASRGTYIVDSTKTVEAGYQTLPEILYSDTAVDSYALTALGQGSGYVSLLFGDGLAFTPKGEPVAMQIIKVEPTLYQGDLRMISASNPLDEQTTVRHSGDFAARPEDYTFEWRYASAVGGLAPPIYRTDMTTVVGNATATPSTANWYQLTNPTAVPPAALVYPTTTVPLPRSILINAATYTANSGRPGQMLKSSVGVTFSGAVSTQVFLSTTLSSTSAGATDGFVLFVNGTPALAYQIPVGVEVPGNLTPVAARSGLVTNGLPIQFELDTSFFQVGSNTVEIGLYSPVAPGAGTATSLDFRLHTPVKTDLVATSGTQWRAPSGNPTLSNTIIIGGSAASPLGNPLLLFADSYFTMRYRAKDANAMVTGASYSEWMQPVLVESWVKRVLDGINPFNQRQTDLYNNPVSTDVSILTQAGKRWEGDVALNLNNINDFGLIEIYETVLNRVKKQSIDANISDDSVDSTLLLVAGYLNDLYMTLGNEAWDDAQNPTILLDGTLGPVDAHTSRFSFEGQVATLMDETLALLRGRDDFLSPGTRTNPSYNRLYWNYTNGINSGEPFYAVNYDIKEKVGSVNANGILDAADAQGMFPQGHGDAYGHYLTALKGYYKLLTAPAFTWVPSTEAVTVLGQAVQVDYQDERKFASAASALARTGADVIDYTARKNHEDSDDSGWVSKKDGKYNPNTGRTRYWGTDEWSSRVFQGAYYNWVAANAMLPDVDTQNEGIQKIDRTTVPELNELVASATEVLNLSFGEQAHLNPLGLAKDAMSFDLSPAEMAAGKSHFEQIYDRAIKASVNARNAYKQAGLMNHQLRQQTNTVDSYNDAIQKQERAYQYELIKLYGTPYVGDIGPGKLYAQGYTGPDLYHSYFIDRPSELVDVSADVTVTFNEPINHHPFEEWSLDNVYERLREETQYEEKEYRMSPYTIGQFSDTVAGGLGRRGQVGEIQTALLDVYEAQVNLRESANTFSDLNKRFDRDYELYSEYLADFEVASEGRTAKRELAKQLSNSKLAGVVWSAVHEYAADFASEQADALAEAMPKVVGTSVDPSSAARAAFKISGALGKMVIRSEGLLGEIQVLVAETQAKQLEDEADWSIEDTEFDNVSKEHVAEFERLYDEVVATAFEMSRRLTELQRATERVAKLYGDAGHILSERETFRQRAGSVLQGYRTRDLVFRELRNEELSQYKGLFDLAQTYTYLAAKAYDYETGLLSTSRGRDFMNGVIGTYSVGAWNGTEPIATNSGDSGLASMLSGLRDDWSVAKGRLGINNPDRNGTLFSLRQELFRITADQPTATDNTLWQQVLQQHIKSNVLDDPDVAIYCTNIRKPDNSLVPGLVIPFSTTIEQGKNFFGWPLAAGDHAFSQSTFATKVFSSGVVFSGYVGMDPFASWTPGAGGPASSDPNALSATPYVYLIPTGEDRMRTPPLGDTNVMRSWSVKDQAIPLPRNLGAAEFSSLQFFTPQGSLNEQLWIRRKHQAFRAVDDPVYFYSSLPAEYTNSRLVGRSVWNTQWKIVIPAYSLLNNEQAGLDRFVKSVSDIKLFLRTYSHSGN